MNFDPYKESFTGLDPNIVSSENFQGVQGRIKIDDFNDLLRKEKERRAVSLITMFWIITLIGNICEFVNHREKDKDIYIE